MDLPPASGEPETRFASSVPVESGVSPSQLDELPSELQRWDTWIRAHRPDLSVQRQRLSVDEPAHWLLESEATESGALAEVLAVFLTNRECPWHCLMCDLWRHTTERTVPAGSIPRQLAVALNSEASGRARHLKLYNAGSFFDSGAIPAKDGLAVAQMCSRFERVIVESHPRLINSRVADFRESLGPAELEVAMGLETANPNVLRRLNKRMTLDDFKAAADRLRGYGVRIRAFILVKPPFLTSESEALEWACRSLDFAWEVGVQVVSLIPTRVGNGAMEELMRRGLFAPPSWATVEAAFRYGLNARCGLVFMDLWNLEESLSRPSDLELYNKLSRMNQTQTCPPEFPTCQ